MSLIVFKLDIKFFSHCFLFVLRIVNTNNIKRSKHHIANVKTVEGNFVEITGMCVYGYLYIQQKNL